MLTNSQRNWLQHRTRRADFLWQWGLGILLVGLLIGIAVDAMVPAWMDTPTQQSLVEPQPDEPHPDEPQPDAPTPEPLPESPFSSDWPRIKRLAEAGRWGKVFLAIPPQILNGWRHRGATVLAVLTGISWLVFLLQTVQPAENRKLRWGACLLGVPLGVLSIWLTLFFILWQEVRWGLVKSNELIPGVQFYVFGVGLREELAKLLCFLPLLPWIVRQRDELAALIAAGCVGLGFAMEENVGYIYSSVGSNTLGRLLMPAPFHIASTGLVGLALYRACRWPRDWGSQALAVFFGVVLVHGAYDSFAALPDLAGYNMGAFILFCLLQWNFYRELRELRASVRKTQGRQKTSRRETISLSFNFITCIALVTSATYIYLAAAVGWHAALNIMWQASVAEALMVYLFLREMPESVVTV